MCATLGLDTAVVRFVAEYASRGAWSLVRSFLRHAVAIVGASSVALSLALVTTVELLDGRLTEALEHTFLAGAALLPALSLLLLVSGVLRGLKRLVVSMLPQWLLRPVLVIVAVAVVVLGATPGAPTVMLLDAAVSGVLVLYLLRAARLRRPVGGAGEPRPPLWTWLATSLPILAQILVRMSMSRVDILLVGALLGTASSGIYTAAAQMSILLTFGSMAVNYAAAPVFAELEAHRRRRELQRVVILGTRAGFLFSLAVAAGLLVVGPFVLSLYGPDFLAARLPLQVLVVSQLLGAAGGSVGFLMVMTGQERPAAWITAGAGLLNLVLNLLLIPRYGLLGAAAATGLANVVWTAAHAVAVHRRIGVNATIFGRSRPPVVHRGGAADGPRGS